MFVYLPLKLSRSLLVFSAAAGEAASLFHSWFLIVKFQLAKCDFIAATWPSPSELHHHLWHSTGRPPSPPRPRPPAGAWKLSVDVRLTLWSGRNLDPSVFSSSNTITFLWATRRSEETVEPIPILRLARAHAGFFWEGGGFTFRWVPIVRIVPLFGLWFNSATFVYHFFFWQSPSLSLYLFSFVSLLLVLDRVTN